MKQLRRFSRHCCVAASAFAAASAVVSGALAEQTVAPIYSSRTEVPETYRWRLEDIYADQAAWDADATKVDALIKDLSARRGSVMTSPESLLQTLKLDEEISAIVGKLYVYAHMRSHEDMASPKPKSLADRATALSVKVSEASSYLAPEILAAPETTLQKWINEPALAQYSLMLTRLLRQKPHVLSDKEEAILAAMGEITSGPDDVFSMLTNADMTFPSITDEKGNSVELTQESYGRYVQSPNRDVRQAAFESLHGTFARYANTLAASYAASVKGDTVFARLRHYPSALEAALFDNEVPAQVYHGLIAAVNRHLPALQKYVALKKEILGVDTMQPWDLYAPCSTESARQYGYDEAKSLVLEALEPLGETYMAALQQAFNHRWIDIYENKGKRSGAYSWGTWGTHPYILLNYSGTFRDVSTLAHEAGHAMHSWFSQQSQPQTYSDYVIFVAEVASTVNETLLAEYLLQRSTDKAEKIFLLSHQLEQIRQTIYRQTLFAEFEERAHKLVAEGETLTPQALNQLWTELNSRYYGAETGNNTLLAVEWSRIPHFYSSFYVYQYATGQAAAIALAGRIMEQGTPAVEDYFNLLHGGSSKDPIALLTDAGVDMASGQAVDQALEVFARKTEELAELLQETQK